MSAAQLDREQLVKVLGLLGSDHPGEVAAAGRAADRLVRKAGFTWPDIVAPALPGPIRERDLESLQDALGYALEFGVALTDWENSFVRSLRRQSKPVSEKQKTILEQIIEKVRRAEARAAA